MILAPAARNLKFPVKFPVSREFDIGSDGDCLAGKTKTLAAMDGVRAARIGRMRKIVIWPGMRAAPRFLVFVGMVIRFNPNPGFTEKFGFAGFRGLYTVILAALSMLHTNVHDRA